MTKRKEEFCELLGHILYERLQPGFAKYGLIANAGQCPFYIFDWWFGKHHTTVKRQQRVHKVTRDGLKRPRRSFRYAWKKTIPNLGLPYKYYYRDHRDMNGKCTVNIHSYYTSLSLFIEESTGRVWCRYTQETVETESNMLIA
jgi:hypothetical protein